MAQVSNASKNDRPVQISATDGIPTAKRRNWSEAAGSQIETLNLGPDDSVIRAWAEQTRDAFNDIRNSPDPGIRNYWWDLHKERILKALDTWGKKKASMANKHLEGAKALVTLHSGNHGNHQTEVRAGSFRFTVSQTLGLHNGDEVILQYHLTPTPHPHPYALSAFKTDPATRLGVSIRGQDSHGGFHCWLEANGKCNLRKI